MKNNWKEKYEKLNSEYTRVMEAYEHIRQENKLLQENYIPRVENDSTYEIIKRLDIIGNMIGNYIKKEETEIVKQKRDRAQEEVDMLSYEYNSRILRYDNNYFCELKNRDTQEY